MISEGDFIQIVIKEKSGISIADARLLFWSMALSVALFIISRRRSDMIRKEIDKLIYGVLKKINLNRLGREGDLFRGLLHIERDVDPESRKKASPYVVERLISEYRVARYSEILKFTLGDADKIDEYERQYNILRHAEISTGHLSWKYGISAAGVAALSYGLYKIFKQPTSANAEKKSGKK